MCKTCENRGLEPRFVIILFGQENGFDHKQLRSYVIDRKYIGEPILLEEVITK